MLAVRIQDAYVTTDDELSAWPGLSLRDFPFRSRPQGIVIAWLRGKNSAKFISFSFCFCSISGAPGPHLAVACRDNNVSSLRLEICFPKALFSDELSSWRQWAYSRKWPLSERHRSVRVLRWLKRLTCMVSFGCTGLSFSTGNHGCSTDPSVHTF